MRKYISFILLIAFLFISSGYHLYFKYLQNNIQQEIEHKIGEDFNENELYIVSNEKEIEWTKKHKEFRYNGMMYDVVKIKTVNDKNIYYCIKDIKEKNLIANFARHNKRINKILQNLKKILNNKYLPKNYSIKFKVGKTKVFFAEYQSLYKSRFKEILPPPPKFNLNIT